MGKWLLYHAGDTKIPVPDLTRGRKNADLGQGFYTTSDRAFAERWARQEPGKPSFINTYSLDTEGLVLKTFSRDGEWACHILGNRAGREMEADRADVVIGPIANDTLFDVMGITAAGILTRNQVLSLLQVGPIYTQTVIRSALAASRLQWLGVQVLTPEKLLALKASLKEEEEKYLSAFSERMALLGLG